MSEQTSILVKEWNEEIQAGKEYRKKHGNPSTWKDYKDYYRGNWRKGTNIPVNRIFSEGRSMIPRTYFRSPAVTVTPTRPQMEWQARIVEAIDNQLIRKLTLKNTLKRSILDAYHSGTGPIKLGFDSEFGFTKNLAALPGGETVTQTSDKQEKTRIEYRTNVQPGMPWAVPIPPMDVITPWGYRDPEEFPWITHEYLRPLKDLVADAKFDQKGRNALKGGFVRDADDPRAGEAMFSSGYNPPALCLVREVRDRKYGRLLVMCEDQMLLEVEDELQINNMPWEFVIFNEDPDHFWGIPDVRMVEPQQLELNEIRTQSQKHRRVAFLKLLYKRGVIKEDQLVKMLSEDVEAIAVDDDEGLLANTIMQLQNHIPPDLAMAAQEVLGDFRETLGRSRNQSGEYKGAGTPPSAAEAQIVQQGSEIRSDERRDVMADILTSIIRKWNQYIFKFWDGEKVSKIIGPDGVKYWIKYTGEEIAGEYDYQVDPDTGLPVTRALRYQQAEKLFAMMNRDPLIDQFELRRLLLRQYEWVDPAWGLVLKTPQAPLPPKDPDATDGKVPGGQGREVGSASRPLSLNEAMKAGG